MDSHLFCLDDGLVASVKGAGALAAASSSLPLEACLSNSPRISSNRKLKSINWLLCCGNDRVGVGRAAVLLIFNFDGLEQFWR